MLFVNLPLLLRSADAARNLQAVDRVVCIVIVYHFTKAVVKPLFCQAETPFNLFLQAVMISAYIMVNRAGLLATNFLSLISAITCFAPVLLLLQTWKLAALMIGRFVYCHWTTVLNAANVPNSSLEWHLESQSKWRDTASCLRWTRKPSWETYCWIS